MIILGITGSIGMGKTACGHILQEMGIPVHEADHAVHDMLAAGGQAESAIIEAFPSLSAPIDRKVLGAIVFADPNQKLKLESILHPLVRQAQQAFIDDHKTHGSAIIALDIPLLFETGSETLVNYTIVASAPPDMQKERVLKRAGMTEEKFSAILAQQMPDEEKRSKADFIVNTGGTAQQTKDQLKEIMNVLKGQK